jgi:hypothetical protein
MEYLVAFFVKLVGFFSFVCFRHTGKAICICPGFLWYGNIEGIAKGILVSKFSR